jgi:DNA-binding NarL/FixJ family response regulator
VLPTAESAGTESGAPGVPASSVPVNGASKIICVFVVDEDETFLRDIEERLNSLDGIRCVGTARGGAEALKRIPEIKPDVVLMEARMNGLSGPDCVRKLKRICPALPCVVIAQTPEERWVIDSLRAGANGFVARTVLLAEMGEMIREACVGDVPLCPLAKRMLVSHHQVRRRDCSAPLVSDREDEVMACLSAGKADKEIATELKISEETVHAHLTRIYAKLAVHSRREAVRKYLGH